MTARYEPLGKERYLIEQKGDGEQIRIKAQRHIFALLFLPVWLAGWTVGGIAAITQLLSHFQPFLLFWSVGWALGWMVVASTILWMAIGSETVRIVSGDLEVAQHMLGFSRRRLYEGRMIRHLAVAGQSAWPYGFSWQMPFFGNGRNGAIRFDYGARTHRLAVGLDESEARQLVERLAKRLPPAARSGQ